MTPAVLLPPFVDKSAERTSALSERLLCRGYGEVPEPSSIVRVEPCACGGRIAAGPGEEAAAVAAHNGSPSHQQWRARRSDRA